MNRGKFVVVEGIDGAGKSTIANWITNNCPYNYHQTPNSAFAEVSHYFNIDKVSPQERFAFYCGENIRASQYVYEETNKGRSIVIERYFLSTICYHKSLYPAIYENNKSLFNFLYKPDLVILVKTSMDVIAQRFSKNNWDANDRFFLRKDLYQVIYENYFEELERLKLPFYVLDNDSMLDQTVTLLKAIPILNAK